MRECSYEVYVAVFDAVREGLSAGDSGVVARISRLIANRSGAAALVSTLALIEARRGDPPRSKKQVCDGVLCDAWCGAGGATRRGPG